MVLKNPEKWYYSGFKPRSSQFFIYLQQFCNSYNVNRKEKQWTEMFIFTVWVYKYRVPQKYTREMYILNGKSEGKMERNKKAFTFTNMSQKKKEII